MITLLVRLYSTSEKVNADLNKASQFGHELAERMTGKEIIDLFMERITKMFPIDSAYIVDDLYGKFQILRAREDGENVELFFAPEDLDSTLAGIIYLVNYGGVIEFLLGTTTKQGKCMLDTKLQ